MHVVNLHLQYNTSQCSNCSAGFNLEGGLACVSVCNDSIVVGTEQCDDGNNADGDGCNADCTIGNNNSCPAASPYIDPLTSPAACTNTCPTGYFADPTNFACLACMYSCITCSDSTSCTSCSASSNRALSASSTCDPLPGFFDNGTQLAPACLSPCNQCTSASVCVTCVPGYFISGSACNICSSAMANCLTCPNATACSSCQLGFIVNATTSLCSVVPCYDLNCLSCPASMAVCVSCVQGYQPASDGSCQTVCGDFVVKGNEVCDDGNTVDDDGCSSLCHIQSNFTCEPDPINSSGSACYYQGQVSIVKVYINKIDFQNQIQILLDLSPKNMSFWSQVDFMNIIKIETTIPITGNFVTKNENGSISITFDYLANIQGQSIKVTIDPCLSNIPNLSRTQLSSANFIVDPDDNQAAYFYAQSTYQMASIIQKMSIGISLSSFFFCGIGLISGKTIGVDMMAVVQISFFSLISLTQMNPGFAALASLKYVNGYNQLKKTYTLNDDKTPVSLKGINFLSRFTENFNFTLAIVVMPLLVALVSFVLSKTALKDNERVVSVAKKAVGEYTLMGILLGGYMIAVCSGLEILYGAKKSSDLIGKISIVECALLLALVAGYFVFLLLRPDFFGEFVDEFKKDRLSSKYYNFVLLERVINGCGLVLLLSVSMGAVLPMAMFLLTAGFVAVKSPHRDNYQKYRVLANMAISLAVEVVYLLYRMAAPEKRHSGMFLYLPFAVVGLLAVCVIYNSILIIYKTYHHFKNNGSQQTAQKQQIDQMARLRKQTMITAPCSPQGLSSSINMSSPTFLKQSIIQQSQLRKQLNISGIKKQLINKSSINLNASQNINESGLINSVLFQQEARVNDQFANDYDAI